MLARRLYALDRGVLIGRISRLESRLQSAEWRHGGRDRMGRAEFQHEKRKELQSLAAGLERGVRSALRHALRGDLGTRPEIVERGRYALGVVDRFCELFGARADLRSRVEGEQLARLALSRLRHRAPGGAVELRIDGRWSVTCHVREMTRALSEILANAVDSGGGPEGVQIRVGGDEREPYLEVRDAGRGMASFRLKRAVTPLFTTVPGRAGLGLYYARVAIERDGGQLTLRSAPGRGTEVKILLSSRDLLDSASDRAV